MRGLLSDRALVLGSRFPGLGKMVQEPRARFHVPEWRVFCYTERLRNRPPRLKLVLSDSAGLSNQPTVAIIHITDQNTCQANRYVSSDVCN